MNKTDIILLNKSIIHELCYLIACYSDGDLYSKQKSLCESEFIRSQVSTIHFLRSLITLTHPDLSKEQMSEATATQITKMEQILTKYSETFKS